jgi:hypothetical protein
VIGPKDRVRSNVDETHIYSGRFEEQPLITKHPVPLISNNRLSYVKTLQYYGNFEKNSLIIESTIQPWTN